MKLPADVRLLLAKRFANRHHEWLASSGEASAWPWDIPLGVPSEQLASRQLDAARAWVAAWQSWRGAGEVHWTERRWRTLGTQRLPDFLRLDDPRTVAQWLDVTGRWDRATRRHAQFIQRWPQLRLRLSKLINVLADYDDADIERLTTLLSWLESNPASGLYLRQLPVPGLDTKWTETRKGILSELIGALRDGDCNDKDFHTLCGLRAPPNLVRMRVLDSSLRATLGGLGDISAPVKELATLPIRPERVLIVENLQSGLALGDMRSTVAFMALGYGVDALAQVPWIASSSPFYWGDIDTHGFAMLDVARACFPSLRSLLMDEEVLLAHEKLWSYEASPHAAVHLPRLTDTEASVHQSLKRNVWGNGVRMEQERIDWALVQQTLDRI